MFSSATNDTANLTAVIEPTTIRGGVGGDVVTGRRHTFFTWQPGEGSDTIDGGPGTDGLAFTGAVVNEHYAVTAISGGFQLTRDIAAVTLQAQSVEWLNLQNWRRRHGDDPSLPSTSQILDGGSRGAASTSSHDAGGACTSAGSSTFAAGRSARESRRLRDGLAVGPVQWRLAGARPLWSGARSAGRSIGCCGALVEPPPPGPTRSKYVDATPLNVEGS